MIKDNQIMLKKFFTAIAFFSCTAFSSISVSCSAALPSNEPGFCESFHVAAECYCSSSGLPRKMCNNMALLYQRMIAMLGSLENACRFQNNTSYQECIDDWVCYRSGGKNSRGELCSGTGNACE
jgi:hypothetical protein